MKTTTKNKKKKVSPAEIYQAQMDFGGWLKDNAVPLATGIGGAALMIGSGGLAAPLAAPMIASGVGMMANSAGQMVANSMAPEQESQVQPQAVTVADRRYAPTFAMGGPVKNKQVGPVTQNQYPPYEPPWAIGNTHFDGQIVGSKRVGNIELGKDLKVKMPQGMKAFNRVIPMLDAGVEIGNLLLQKPGDYEHNIVYSYENDNLPNISVKDYLNSKYGGIYRNGGYLSSYGAGGPMPQVYEGQSHLGPNGGIPIDRSGNPSAVSNNKPVALVESGEVSWMSPQGTPYIFSDKLGFAKQAKSIMNKYKPRLGKDFDKTDKLSTYGLNTELGKLMEKQETLRAGMDMMSNQVTYGNGGSIKINPENKGKFTAWAKEHGMSVKEAATHVMAHKEQYSPTVVKRANFAKNFAHEYGGPLPQYLDGGGFTGELTDPPYQYEWPIPQDSPVTKVDYANSTLKTSTPTKPQGSFYPSYLASPEVNGAYFRKQTNKSTPPNTWYSQPTILGDPNYKAEHYNATVGPDDISYDLGSSVDFANQAVGSSEVSQKNKPGYKNPFEFGTADYIGYGAQLAAPLANLAITLANKPKKIKTPYIEPELVNLESEREAARRDATLAANINRRNARGGSFYNYYSNALAGTNAAQRALGDTLSRSYMNERNTNAQIINQNRAANAEQERYYENLNAQERDAYLGSLANSIGQFGQVGAGFVGERNKMKSAATYGANMGTDSRELVFDKANTPIHAYIYVDNTGQRWAKANGQQAVRIDSNNKIIG